MIRFVALLSFALLVLSAPLAEGQDSFANFGVVVQLPSYEAYLKNFGSTPVRVDGYALLSASGSLNPVGWTPLDTANPAAVVAALGPGADGFFVANPQATSIAELNPIGSATWMPGQSWSIGFPFNTASPGFALDARFMFASPDGLVLTGGTVVAPSQMAPASFVVVPEATGAALAGNAAVACMAVGHRQRRRRPLG